ncbi:MAG: hypothetical protein AMXMBFR56_61760 [Polyangiaceae bacterium]
MNAPINIEMEPWVSATQISTFELCNRKWAWRWLEGVKAPPNKFAQLGIDTHGKLEKWLRGNVVPSMESQHADAEHRKRDEQAVKLAQAMIPYLPPPQAVNPNDVERDELIFVQDVLFIVKIDLFMPEMVSWDGVVRPRTCDHKTTGDFKWLPEASQIHYDPQAALYSAWTIIHTGKTEIDLQWNYVRTKGAIKVEPVCATVTDAMITPRMQANVETGRQIKKLIALKERGLRALDVVHDARACDEYGGCPYQDRCGISGKERIVSIMSDIKGLPATQQFLAGLGGSNGQPINPPAFAPPQQPGGFAPPQQPGGFAPPQQPGGFAPPQQPGGFAPPQQPGGFAPPQQPGGFAPPQQPGGFAPPQQPGGFAPPQQPGGFAPPQAPQAPQQFTPPQQGFAPPAAPQQPAPTVLQQLQNPQAQQPAPAEPKGPGRPKNPKEYDLAGAWATLMSGCIVVCSGNIIQAAQLADQALLELKARQ